MILWYFRNWPRFIGMAFLLGNELNPLRGTNSKWDVTFEEYAPKMYPSFVSGWAYATTVTAARLLVQESDSSPFFWIDDVFVTGILASRCGVFHVNIRSRLTVNEEHVACCLQQRPLAACRYIIAPVVDVILMEKFYRHAWQCRVKECPVDNQSCIIDSKSSVKWSYVPRIEGQVIPIFKWTDKIDGILIVSLDFSRVTFIPCQLCTSISPTIANKITSKNEVFEQNRLYVIYLYSWD